jgi:hypothetical protein
VIKAWQEYDKQECGVKVTGDSQTLPPQNDCHSHDLDFTYDPFLELVNVLGSE